MRLDIDRAKAEQLGVPLQRLFDALGTYVGSSFVNLFNRFGFVYQVYVQSEASGRRKIADLERLTVLNSQGEPVRIGSLVTPRFVSGPTAVLSYNTYRRGDRRRDRRVIELGIGDRGGGAIGREDARKRLRHRVDGGRLPAETRGGAMRP